MKRHVKNAGFALGIALLLGSGVGRLCAAAELPKAEAILDRYIEVTGGRAAYEQNHNEVTTGTMEIVGAGIQGKVAFYSTEPNKSFSEIVIEGIGSITEGTDGKVAWSLSAMQGPRIKDGEERAVALREATFNNHLRWQELYKQAQTVGVETIDGKECYKVVLTPPQGGLVTRYYDRQSGFLVKSAMTVKTAMGDIPVESAVSDYRKAGGLTMPYKLVQKAAGQQIAVTVDTIKFNAEIPAARFELPEEIRALGAAKK